MRLIAVVTWVALAILLGVGAAHAEKRVALVIGNSGYRSVAPLDNPANDARLIADTLRALGFTLVGGGAQVDLDKAAIDRAVQDFGTQLAGADVGLFYYAGHGVQVRGANYLVPVDAHLTREADVDFQMLDTSAVLRQMEEAGTRLNIVILDACRNDPFIAMRGLAGRTRDVGDRGLARMQAPEGTLISFATQPGSVAQDGSDGHSPFSRALAETIRRPGLGIFDTFNQVGLAVKRATAGAQQPWLSSSPIDGAFYFVPSGKADDVAVADPHPVAPARPSPGPRLEGTTPGPADVRRFNGVWVANFVCAPKGEVPRVAGRVVGRASNGSFHGERGQEGKPGWETYDGTIDPDGSIRLDHNGLTGDGASDPFHRPTGTKFNNVVEGVLDRTSGAAARTDRDCDYKFVKLSAPPSSESNNKSSAPPKVAFDEAAVRLLAARQGIPLPPTLSVVGPGPAAPALAADLGGVWGGNQGWDGHGRNIIVVVEDVGDSGKATVMFAEGPPNRTTASQNAASFRNVTGALIDDGFTFDRGTSVYTFKLLPDGQLWGHVEGGPEHINATITLQRITSTEQVASIAPTDQAGIGAVADASTATAPSQDRDRVQPAPSSPGRAVALAAIAPPVRDLADEAGEFRQKLFDALALARPTGTPESTKSAVATYLTLREHKAIAADPSSGHLQWRFRQTAQEAETSNLEACEMNAGAPCVPVAVDETLQLTSAADLKPRSMPRVVFTGEFDPAQIPAVVDSVRHRGDVVKYRKARSPKAAALHPSGQLFLSNGAKSQRGAEEQVLAACEDYRSSHHIAASCFLYASDNQVVLDRRSNTPITP